VSLRTRLLVGLLALAAVGLVILDLVSYAALSSYLTQRVDQQVESAVEPVTHQIILDLQSGAQRPGLALPLPGFPPPENPASQLPPGTYGELLDARGKVVDRVSFSYGEGNLATPVLPKTLPTSSSGSTDIFTVAATDGSASGFRAVALPVPDGSGTVVVAVPLRDVEQTLSRLRLIEVIVTGAVLAALAALTWWVVRLGLRPLERMEQTANAIGAGDLSQRVDTTDERTEVGRLGLALNAMLGQIEGAFAERQASEDRLRRFLADASHELRTPLSSIRGYAELFRLGPAQDPEQLTSAMSRIEDEADRMGRLVDDLLLLARLDEVRDPLREPVDLVRLAEDACDDARASAPSRPISMDAPPEPLTVPGDPDQLRQVLTNLLRNALVHTPEGSPVAVSVRREGESAVIRVRDRGPGLPDGAADRVFERFWRQGDSRSRDRGGAGLGLAIVSAVAAAHGGSAGAGNAEGGGAVFTISLPLRASNPARVPVA
jgi:two-component system OmpR family sensor kinase